MSNDYSNFERRRSDLRRRAGSDTGLYLMLGGAAVLAAVVGGLVVYALTPSAPVANTVALNPPPAPSVPSSAPAASPSTAQPQGAPAAAAPVWKTVGTYGSWQVRCQAQNAKVCTAVLEVINQQDKGVLMAWIIGTDNKGALQTVFQTPTGVMVASGIDVKFGKGTRHINYLSCLPQQCTATSAMDEVFVKEATGTAKADVVLYASNGKSLDFGIPMTGLDKALAALKK